MELVSRKEESRQLIKSKNMQSNNNEGDFVYYIDENKILNGIVSEIINKGDSFYNIINGKKISEKNISKKEIYLHSKLYNINFEPSDFRDNRPIISLESRKKLIKLYQKLINDKKG